LWLRLWGLLHRGSPRRRILERNRPSSPPKARQRKEGDRAAGVIGLPEGGPQLDGQALSCWEGAPQLDGQAPSSSREWMIRWRTNSVHIAIFSTRPQQHPPWQAAARAWLRPMIWTENWVLNPSLISHTKPTRIRPGWSRRTGCWMKRCRASLAIFATDLNRRARTRQGWRGFGNTWILGDLLVILPGMKLVTMRRWSSHGEMKRAINRDMKVGLSIERGAAWQMQAAAPRDWVWS